MTRFIVGGTISTDTPGVEVDAGLAVGFHRFRLSVADAAGTTSAPDEVVVEVRSIRPTPIPTPTPVIRTPLRAKPTRKPS